MLTTNDISVDAYRQVSTIILDKNNPSSEYVSVPPVLNKDYMEEIVTRYLALDLPENRAISIDRHHPVLVWMSQWYVMGHIRTIEYDDDHEYFQVLDGTLSSFLIPAEKWAEIQREIEEDYFAPVGGDQEF